MTNPSRGELVPGGMAMVIGAGTCKGNIGREVTLERFIPPFSEAFHCDGYFEADHEGLWIVGGESLERNTEGGILISDIAAHLPRHLMPIAPRPNPLEITQHQEQSA